MFLTNLKFVRKLEDSSGLFFENNWDEFCAQVKFSAVVKIDPEMKSPLRLSEEELF